MAVVGQFGANGERPPAVGTTNSLVNLLVNVFIGLLTGVSAVVARH